MEPSAKRALLLPAWLERKLCWRVAGFLACGLLPNQGVVTGGVRAFFGPCAARRRCGWLAVGVVLECRGLRGNQYCGERGGTEL